MKSQQVFAQAAKRAPRSRLIEVNDLSSSRPVDKPLFRPLEKAGQGSQSLVPDSSMINLNWASERGQTDKRDCFTKAMVAS